MRVNGICDSTIAPSRRMAWDTVAPWLELAAKYAERFNLRMLKDFALQERQAEEIWALVGPKKRVLCVLTTLEVWSRLWISVVVGHRKFRNVKGVILNTLERGRVEHRFLFTTGGFEMYESGRRRNC